jgi:hypothetical protein
MIWLGILLASFVFAMIAAELFVDVFEWTRFWWRER